MSSADSQRGGAIRSFLIFVVVIALAAAAAVGGGGYFAWREANRTGPSPHDVVYMLEQGSSVARVSRELKQAGVIRHPQLFSAVVRYKGVGGDLKAGEYRIPAGVSTIDLVQLLVDGKSILHYVTAPEGLTTAQIVRIVEADETLAGEITLSPKEGDLLPETYAFTRGQTRDQILTTMMKAQDAYIESIWSERAMDLPFSTQQEAIILASIVEKETGVEEERTRVAAVFVNRLRKGMRLESDPTIIYGLTGGEPLGRGLRASELRKETPYNTYVIKGLPPTPIANPGKASIAAVLNPADTDEIFFVADGSGGHAFASTLAEHNRNVAKWRQVERERKSAGE